MNPNHHCESYELIDLLHDDCDVTELSLIEQHLEMCQHCQTRLSQLAADDELWTQTAKHLSTIEQIELPNRITSHLNSTSSFVVPTVGDDSRAADRITSLPGSESDWTRILDAPSHPEMLGKIDQFEVDAKIGQGGMGIVLKGIDPELNRAVAIKVLAPYLASNGTARKRFAREAQAAAAVVHPNVVPIYAVNSSPTRPYIVMQLVPGNSLQTLIQDNGPLEPKDIVRVSMQIARGLAAAHNQGLIHRDVKPGNILIEKDVSRVMITDFGLARAVDDAGMTQTGWLAGTPHYMSPEQSRGDDLDPRSDLFSLGSLMYFLATGREPFRGDKPYAVIQKIINHAPTHPIELNAEVPGPLADIIEKLLEKEPKNRFQSAHDVGQVLEHYLAHLQQPKKTPAPKRILTVRRRRQRFWLAGTVIGISAIVIAAGILLPNWVGSQPGPESMGPAFSVSPPEAIGDQPPVATIDPNPEIATSPSVPMVPPALRFDDQEFSQQLELLMQDIDELENRFHQTDPLVLESPSGSDFSHLMQLESLKIESGIQQLESTFESEIQIRDLIDRIENGDATPKPETEQNQPVNEPSNQPETKGKLDDED